MFIIKILNLPYDENEIFSGHPADNSTSAASRSQQPTVIPSQDAMIADLLSLDLNAPAVAPGWFFKSFLAGFSYLPIIFLYDKNLIFAVESLKKNNIQF